MTANVSKPNLLFVFAHPDDDAFGPSGTLIKMSENYNVHFVCVTNGGSGENHSQKTGTIENIRKKELRDSAEIIGAKSLKFLDYDDGGLCNNLYTKLAADINMQIELLRPSILMTWEPKGITGHIDHIVVSLVCHFLFSKHDFVKKLMLYCLSSYQTKEFLNDYFVYRPQGYKPCDIDLVVDISDVWDKKIKAIKCHESQIKDFQKIMNRPKIRLMEDCFQVLSKEDGEK